MSHEQPEGSAPGPGPAAPDTEAEGDEQDIGLEFDLEPEPDALDWASRAALRDLLHAVEEHLTEHNQEPGDVLYQAMMLAKAELAS